MSHSSASFGGGTGEIGGSEIRITPGQLEPLPGLFTRGNVSIVIPVKNNQAGIDRLLAALQTRPEKEIDQFLMEVIIVDDRSSRAVYVPPDFKLGREINPRSVRVYRGEGRGPAAARNLGAAKAIGEWLLFMDSDCVPTESTLSGYQSAAPGAIGYAGAVSALPGGSLSSYYETQGILASPAAPDGRPQYLVTANALVLRRAFQRIGGFNERIEIAGGEDIDLSLRLAKVGRLDWARESKVMHDFSDGLSGFWKRFVRYGKGNRIVDDLHGSSGAPKPFAPRDSSLANWIAAYVQHQAMRWGYEGPGRILFKQAALWALLGPVGKLMLDSTSLLRHVIAAKKNQ